MRPPFPNPSACLFACLSTIAAPAAAATPAVANAPLSVHGFWQATAPGQWDQARFGPDGSYILLEHRANGLRVVVWGRYAETVVAPREVELRLTPKDWDPQQICRDFGDPGSCQKVSFPPGLLDVTLERPDAILIRSGGSVVEFLRHADDKTLVPQQTGWTGRPKVALSRS